MKRIFDFGLVPGYVALARREVVLDAPPSQAINGTWQFANIIPLSKHPVDGGKCVIEAVAISNLRGNLVGVFIDHLRIVRRARCDQSAAEIFQTEGTYQGIIAGVSGSIDLLGEGRTDPQGNLQSQFTIQGGSGALAKLQGRLVLKGNLVTGGTYSGSVHFA